MCHEIDSFDDNLIYHTEAYFPSNFFDNEICVFVDGTLPDFKMLRNGQVYKKNHFNLHSSALFDFLFDMKSNTTRLSSRLNFLSRVEKFRLDSEISTRLDSTQNDSSIE